MTLKQVFSKTSGYFELILILRQLPQVGRQVTFRSVNRHAMASSVPGSYDALFAKVQNQPGARYQQALDLTVDLCERLICEGVDSFHLYTLNQTDMCLDVSLALGASLQAPEITSAA